MEFRHAALIAGQAHSTAQAGPPAQPVLSTALLQGNRAVAISHNGMLYTLQVTKLGKLILTK
jgi:hemin uptake protein HemP